MDLRAHADTGWGYAGPKTKEGVPDISGRIHVDPSRPLPDATADVRRAYRNATVRAHFEALEPRLNVFGYSFHHPFITECDWDARRAMACPPPMPTPAAGTAGAGAAPSGDRGDGARTVVP